MLSHLNNVSIKDHPVLGSFEWSNIPMLSVITGVNGSGKTKLLDLIYAELSQAGHRDPRIGQHIKLNLTIDHNLTKYDSFYVRAQQGASSLGRIEVGNCSSELENFVQIASAGGVTEHRDINQWRIAEYIRKKTGGDPLSKSKAYYEGNEFKGLYLDAWTYLQDVGINQHISRLFLNYYIKKSDIINANWSPEGKTINQENLKELLNEAPWVLINNLFEKYNFKYRINYPTSIASNLVIKFSPPDNSFEILYEQLSSGEQMIVNLILWSFNEELGQHRKLVILDEPDAHLHPEMGLMFKEIVTEVLVNKLGIQVIMTTHSPTTLCWMEENTIFLLGPKEGVKQTTKIEAMQKLTSGLVMVHEAFKVILVEDEQDQKFYQNIFDLLYFNRKVSKNPKLIFRSVTHGDATSGGRSNIVTACNNWEGCTKFSSEISSLLMGLVDNDNKGREGLSASTLSLNRYCLENYLADPLLVFAVLVDNHCNDIKNLSDKINYKKGDQHFFKSGRIKDSQEVVDFMCKKIPQEIINKNLVEITYINGIIVTVPECFFNLSGKDDLLKFWRTAFPSQASNLNFKSLLSEIERTLLIPSDLSDLFIKLQI